MRTRGIIGGLLGVLAFAGIAGAGDSTSRPFTNPTLDSTPFQDCVSSGQYKGSGTKIQIQLKGLQGLPDTDQVPCSGDEVICVQNATSSVPNVGVLNNGIVFRGEVKKGKVQIKHDLCKENSGLCPGGPTGTVRTYNEDVLCYEADPNFAPALFLTLPQAGGCEGLVYNAQPTPSTPLMARVGTTSGCP